MFPSFFILICFSTLKYFLNEHNSKKQLHVLLKKQSHIDIFSEVAVRSLENIEMFPEAATQFSA